MEFGPSVPKFPLDNGVLPLIDDSDDNSNGNNNTENVGSVVQKIQTFLDLDMNLDLETDHQEVKKSRATRQISKISETVSNNSTESKNPRASGRLRSRVNTNGTSSIPSSNSSSAISTALVSVDPTTATSSNTNNNISMGRSKRSSPVNSATQASVPITIIDDGDEIKDQNIKTVDVIPTMKLKAVKFAKGNIKKEKNDVKKKR